MSYKKAASIKFINATRVHCKSVKKFSYFHRRNKVYAYELFYIF